MSAVSTVNQIMHFNLQLERHLLYFTPTFPHVSSEAWDKSSERMSIWILSTFKTKKIIIHPLYLKYNNTSQLLDFHLSLWILHFSFPFMSMNEDQNCGTQWCVQCGRVTWKNVDKKKKLKRMTMWVKVNACANEKKQSLENKEEMWL